MDALFLVGLGASFIVGTCSSIFAAWILLFRRRSKFRLRFNSVIALIGELADEIAKDGYDYDHIVSIGRNSGIAGSIMAGMVGLDAVVSLSLKKRRLPDGNRSIDLDNVARDSLGAMSQKKVLVLICCNDSGATLQFVVGKLKEVSPPPTEIRTAALYTAPSPLYRPHYSSVVVGHDTKKTMTEILHGLPWTSDRWIHPFRSERDPNTKK